MAELEATIDIDAPPEVVFDHLVTPEGMVAWMGERAELDATEDGRFAVDIEGSLVRGRFLHVERPVRVVVTWGLLGADDLPPGASTVDFTLARIPTGTRVTVRHHGLPESRRPGHERGWDRFLAALARAAASPSPTGMHGDDVAVMDSSSSGSACEVSIGVGAAPDRVAAALTTLDGLRGWWTPTVEGGPEPGAVLRFGFAGVEEEIRMRVDETTATAVPWTCLGHSSAPSWSGTRVRFAITPAPDGTRLVIRHEGLPGAEVEGGWRHFAASIASWAATGRGHPYAA